MREVDIGSKKHTVVQAVDEPAPDGAHHEYCITSVRDPDRPTAEFGHIQFQKGPIKEVGVNGCHQEDLIVVCIDRLQGFQAGVFKCDENDLAITKLKQALFWLNQRTQGRVKRGVEGTTAI